MLGKLALQITDGQVEWVRNESLDNNSVLIDCNVLYWTMIAVITGISYWSQETGESKFSETWTFEERVESCTNF